MTQATKKEIQTEFRLNFSTIHLKKNPKAALAKKRLECRDQCESAPSASSEW